MGGMLSSRVLILVALAGAGCSSQGMQPDQQAAPAAAPGAVATDARPAEAVPPEPLASLEPEPHTWVVIARKGAEVIATSPTFRFTITP